MEKSIRRRNGARVYWSDYIDYTHYIKHVMSRVIMDPADDPERRIHELEDLRQRRYILDMAFIAAKRNFLQTGGFNFLRKSRIPDDYPQKP